MRRRYLTNARGLLLLLASLGLVFACERQLTYPLKMPEALTESIAIDVTRNALHDSGIEASDLVPVAYDPDKATRPERYFARNQQNPNRGYVLWKLPGSQREWDLQVYIELEGESVRCKVTRPL
jgi:hypothetical protein